MLLLEPNDAQRELGPYTALIKDREVRLQLSVYLHLSS